MADENGDGGIALDGDEKKNRKTKLALKNRKVFGAGIDKIK